MWFIYSPVYSFLFGLDLFFFFKTRVCLECRLINGGYNSWKPFQCFLFGPHAQQPVPSPHSFFHSPPLLVCLISLPRCVSSSLSLSLSLHPPNQLNQTVESTSCPSGLLRPPLPVCVISLVSKHIVLTSCRPGLGNNLGGRKWKRGKEKHEEEVWG